MIKLRTLLHSVAVAMVCLVATSASALQQTNQPSQAMRDASALLQAGKFAEAAEAYEAITKAEPNNALAWSQLGTAFISAGNYADAAKAFHRAVEITNNPVAMYNLACSYARLNDKDKAFEWLNKSINAKFPQPALISTDPDLASLRQDGRFKAVEASIEKLTKPCMYSEVHRQFNFWVGEWNVTTPQGQQAGTNTVKMLEDGCIIEENWTGVVGGTGKSINFFDSTKGKWRQTWVSSTGSVSEFAGEYRDGAMRFEGESHLPNGQKILRRLTFFNLDENRVRQFSEASVDGGKTWNVNYDFTYTRKNEK